MHAIHDHLAAGGEGVAAGGVFPHSQSDAMQYRPMPGLRKAQNRKSKYGIHVANEFLVRQVRHPAVLLANKEIGVHLRVPQGVVPSTHQLQINAVSADELQQLPPLPDLLHVKRIRPRTAAPDVTEWIDDDEPYVDIAPVVHVGPETWEVASVMQLTSQATRPAIMQIVHSSATEDPHFIQLLHTTSADIAAGKPWQVMEIESTLGGVIEVHTSTFAGYFRVMQPESQLQTVEITVFKSALRGGHPGKATHLRLWIHNNRPDHRKRVQRDEKKFRGKSNSWDNPEIVGELVGNGRSLALVHGEDMIVGVESDLEFTNEVVDGGVVVHVKQRKEDGGQWVGARVKLCNHDGDDDEGRPSTYEIGFNTGQFESQVPKARIRWALPVFRSEGSLFGSKQHVSWQGQPMCIDLDLRVPSNWGTPVFKTHAFVAVGCTSMVCELREVYELMSVGLEMDYYFAHAEHGRQLLDAKEVEKAKELTEKAAGFMGIRADPAAHLGHSQRLHQDAPQLPSHMHRRLPKCSFMQFGNHAASCKSVLRGGIPMRKK
jgi:hypothetical protein